MSAWSDWKCGAISEQEYKTAYNMDPAEDHGEDLTEIEFEPADDFLPDDFSENEEDTEDEEKEDNKLFIQDIYDRMTWLSPKIIESVGDLIWSKFCDYAYTDEDVLDFFRNTNVEIRMRDYWCTGQLFSSASMSLETTKGKKLYGISVDKEKIEKIRNLCDAILSSMTLSEKISEEALNHE